MTTKSCGRACAPFWKATTAGTSSAKPRTASDAISLILDKTPDVAIVDYSLPLINGVEVTRSVKARQLATEVLIFTMHDSDELVKESFKAGAKAFS